MGTLFLMESPGIRRMEPRDLRYGLALTQAQRWSHRLEDWEFHYRLGHGWVACDANDRPFGTALWWPYGPHFGTLGLVVVDAQYQGRGIGRKLVTTVIKDAGPRTLQLIATAAGLKLYSDLGFRARGIIEQRQGVPASVAPAQAPPGVTLREVSHDDIAALCALDAAAFGADRGNVISAVLAAGRGVLAEREGRAVGFALRRQSGRGDVVGPLVAGDERLAIALVSHLLTDVDILRGETRTPGRHSSGFTRIDISAEATELGAWLDIAGLASVDRVTAMIRGNPPEAGREVRVLGLISQALG